LLSHFRHNHTDSNVNQSSISLLSIELPQHSERIRMTTMTPKKRKTTKNSDIRGPRPAKRHATGRQFIVEDVVAGTTRQMLMEFFKPHDIVDEVNIQALEEGSSRRTALVTLAKPNGVDEAQDIISRLSGTFLNGKQVSIRMLGKPSNSLTALVEASSASPARRSGPKSQADANRRVTRATRKVIAPVFTLPASNAGEGPGGRSSQAELKDEIDERLIVAHQYDDIDIKPETKEQDTDDASVLIETGSTILLEDNTETNSKRPRTSVNNLEGLIDPALTSSFLPQQAQPELSLQEASRLMQSAADTIRLSTFKMNKVYGAPSQTSDLAPPGFVFDEAVSQPDGDDVQPFETDMQSAETVR
jgi:hypothetical protein